MTCLSVYTQNAVLELAFGLGMLASAMDERERLFPVSALQFHCSACVFGFI